MVKTLEPMLCQPGEIQSLTSDRWAFETKHDGNRLLVRHDNGELSLQSRSGRDSTEDYRLAIDSDYAMLLDGEAVSLNKDGVPEFNLIQNRATTKVEYWAFDILELDGQDLTKIPYRLRREILEKVGQVSTGFHVPPLLDVANGAEAQAATAAAGAEGVIAKSWGSFYEFGRRSKNWLKSKNWLEMDVVVGGWKWGTGRREGTIGSVLVGIPDGDRLRFCGRVGTGFNDDDLGRLLSVFRLLQTDCSPFSPKVLGNDGRGAQWVTPMLTAAVQYGLMTDDGRMRHPSWRGLR
jgi:bifunctional non-homologous end joining protein LigD